jgi:hypothetical protein
MMGGGTWVKFENVDLTKTKKRYSMKDGKL